MCTTQKCKGYENVMSIGVKIPLQIIDLKFSNDVTFPLPMFHVVRNEDLPETLLARLSDKNYLRVIAVHLKCYISKLHGL